MSGLADLRVSRTTVDVLEQHRDALETLRTVFNALEAKQRQQARLLFRENSSEGPHQRLDRYVEALSGDINDLAKQQQAFVARSFWQRLRWLFTGF